MFVGKVEHFLQASSAAEASLYSHTQDEREMDWKGSMIAMNV